MAEGVAVDKTLWFIADYSTDPDVPRRGNKRYYICYEQQYVNENPFHAMDENKPAWIAHTTIPHTLMGAMLNLAWMYAAGPTPKLKVCDPFVGSGTTWFEASKFGDIDSDVSDRMDCADQLAKDNLEFFALSAAGIRQLARQCEYVRDCTQGVAVVLPEDLSDEFEEVMAGLHEFDGAKGILLHPKHIDWLRQKSLLAKILFYTGLKAAVRHGAAITRQQERLPEAFVNELDILLADIAEVRRIREGQSADTSEAGRAIVPMRDPGLIRYPSFYSEGCSISPCLLRRLAERYCARGPERIVEQRDALVLEEEKYDVLIADPPYGINADQDATELSWLYRKMIPCCLKALRDGGQLILALPEASRTGRPCAFFTRGEMIQHQIIVEARKLKMDVVAVGHAGSRPAIARPPYYWESERALRRSILHFRFRRNS